jgi:2-isopropylmalate synthase
LSQITGVSVQPNKAIVGANAFSHESGIHQDGLLKEKITYEIMTPESIGIPQSTLVLGKHSGRHALRAQLKKLGYELSEGELNSVFKRFKDLADKKKEVFDGDMEAIVSEVMLKVPERYKLLHINVTSGTLAIPTATVELEIEGEVVKQAGFGDGPVDAAMEVLRKCVADVADIRLEEYHVDAIQGGTDALVDVTVRLSKDGKIITSHGARTDIIMASVEAMIAGMNRLLREEHENRGKNPR